MQTATTTTLGTNDGDLTPQVYRRTHALLDAGGVATLSLLVVGFVVPWLLCVYLGGAPAHPGTLPNLELRMLLWSALLALLLPLIQINLHIRQFGGSEVRGNRSDFPSADGAGARVARAHHNLLESLVPFAIAVMATVFLGFSTRWTIAASVLFLVARLIHAASYALGLTIVRSAAFYASHLATIVIISQLLMVVPGARLPA